MVNPSIVSLLSMPRLDSINIKIGMLEDAGLTTDVFSPFFITARKNYVY